MKQKVLRTGNSLAVVIPSNFAKNIGIKAGDSVDISFDQQNAKLTYLFSGTLQLPLTFQKEKK